MTRQRLSQHSRPSWPVLVLLAALLAALFLAPVSGAEGPLSGEKICLDPGHGGSDPGAVQYGLYESHINLDVSFALAALLAGQGAETVMTRTGDTYLTNRDRYTFCNGVGADLLISVHTNSVDNDLWDGSTTLWSKREDQALAQAIHDVLYEELKVTAPAPEAFLDFGLTKFQSGVLLKSDMPAAMMEPVFMSYPAEAALLVDPVYYAPQNEDEGPFLDLSCRRGQIAQAILDGILSYYGIAPEPAPTISPEPTATTTPEPPVEPTATPTPEPAPTSTPEPLPPMHVASIDMGYVTRGPNYFVNTKVKIIDEHGTGVPEATVTLTFSGPDGTSIINSRTGSDGVATFSVKVGHTGTYRSTVSGVDKEGWEYDAGKNIESEESLDMP